MTKEIEMKYKSKTTGNIYSVIWTDDNGVLLENPNGLRNWYSNKAIKDYLEEYREPVVVKSVRKVVLIGSEISTRSENCGWRMDECIVGKVELIVTDGELTEARVL
jgi:hypothetical protein